MLDRIKSSVLVNLAAKTIFSKAVFCYIIAALNDREKKTKKYSYIKETLRNANEISLY